MLDPDPSAEDPPAVTQRNDSISPIAVIVLVLFWVLQSSLVTLPTIVKHRSAIARRSSASDVGTSMPSEVETGILDIDLNAKSSYVTYGSGARSGSSSKGMSAVLDATLSQTGAKSRNAALREALRLFGKYPDDPSLARRVILLRAEAGNTNPLGPVLGPALHPHGKRKIVFPLDAYDTLSSPAASPDAQNVSERATWQALFGSQAKIPPGQVAALAVRIRSMENLRWWTNVALHQLYWRADEAEPAAQSLAVAGRQADVTIALSGLLTLASCACLLVGVIAIYVLVVKSASAQGEQIAHAESGSIFDPTPARINDSDRKLGAGDLANLFALYLILMMAVPLTGSFLLGGFLGNHAGAGSNRTSFIIFVEAIATAFCGGVTVAALFCLAKKRGASVADEVGLNAGGAPLWRVVLFGALGWCISLPLLFGIGYIASLVFRNAPAPANPAIPLLMANPGGIAAVALFILVAVLAPFFEETVFRGLFYNAARLRVGVRSAILLTGLAFGLSHSVGIAEQMQLVVFGCVLAWVAQTRKSLLPGMVLHSLQNSFSYATLLFTLMTVVPSYPVMQ